jgi:DNA-binding transcriptional MerR regulator
MMPHSIPHKSNFKFQELTPITGVKPYVIRYWETEFPEIAPISSEKGEKIYARKDIEAILRVKKYLFEDKMTISEAKARMSSGEQDLPEMDGEAPSKGEASTDVLSPLIKDALKLIEAIKSKRKW